ncbi:hypothetical protein [Streptomyces cellulosae]|uniref:Uncharacterized protein n=1 Tax=Streptomyces cellulosae TaxID=1968 RepID=A0ABW7YLJ7_STRCE
MIRAKQEGQAPPDVREFDMEQLGSPYVLHTGIPGLVPLRGRLLALRAGVGYVLRSRLAPRRE